MHRYHHRERFNLTNRRVAADPAQQLRAEREQSARRDFIQDCMDFLEGRDTDGARRARAEHDRLPGDALMLLGTNTPASTQNVGTQYSEYYQKVAKSEIRDDEAFGFIARVDKADLCVF